MSTKISSLIFRVDGDATGASRAFNKVGSSATGLGRKIAGIGAAIGVAFSVREIAHFASSLGKMSMEFDSTMLRMVTLAGKTTEEIAAMRPEIIKTATQFGKSAQEAAEAMYFIASSGVEGSQGMEILNKSLLMSAAGMGDAETLADMLTSAMNAYGSSALSATEATDYLIGAVRAGKADPAELAGAMARVLPIASNMGVKFREVAAAFAALSTGGTDANEAATQLRGILASVLKPTMKAEKTLKNMGMTSEGLRKVLKEKGLLSLLGLLREKFKGNSTAIAGVFGNVRALTGLLDLTGVKWKKSVEIFDQVMKSGGASDEIEALLQNDPGFKYRQALQGLKNAMIEVGDAIAPVMASFATWLSGDGMKAMRSFLDGLLDTDRTAALGRKKDPFGFGSDNAQAQGDKRLRALKLLGESFRNLADAVADLFSAFDDGTGQQSGIIAFLNLLTKINDIISSLLRGLDSLSKKIVNNGANGDSMSSKFINLLAIITGADPQGGLMGLNGNKGRKRRAIGGTVSGGSSYLVGERGPELFTPTANGTIIPNNRLGSSAQPINVTVNVHGSVIRERDLASSVRDQIAQLMRRRGLDPSILGV